MIDDLVALEELYVAQHQLRLVIPMLMQARDKFTGNHKVAVAVRALFICLRATDEALDEEREAAELMMTFSESRKGIYKVRSALRGKKARA